MTGEQLFMLVIVVIAALAVAFLLARKKINPFGRMIWNRPIKSLRNFRRKRRDSEYRVVESEPKTLSAEAASKAELERLQKIIRDRIQIAWETDISYHLWNLYKNYFRSTSPELLGSYDLDGKWYDLKILQAGSSNNLNKYEFELNGTRFKFVDDEEQRAWSDNMKYFSLFLYDDSGRCLIEIPMKLRVDRWGKHYSPSSDAPNAFIPGDWISEFVNATLKHQSLRNQEIRAQKHQERLWEIEDLKARYGISD